MARNLVHFDPFAGFDILRRDLLDDGLATALRGMMPTTDVYTVDDQALVIEAHLPHFAEDDITVSLDKGSLVIQAERRESEEDKKKKYVVRESSTSFYRNIVLPDHADGSTASAHFKDGVLTVTVPFAQVSSPKKIPIGGKAAAHPSK